MNAKNLAIASLVGAAVSLIFANVPFLNLTCILLCAPFWAGALLAVWLYKRLNGPITLKDGVIIGLITGVVTGVIGFALSFVGMAGGEAFANSIKTLAPEAEVDMAAGSGVIFNLAGVVVDIIFGTIGGLIGGLLFQPKK
jgi:hypothetical protein